MGQLLTNVHRSYGLAGGVVAVFLVVLPPGVIINNADSINRNNNAHLPSLPSPNPLGCPGRYKLTPISIVSSVGTLAVVSTVSSVSIAVR